MSDFKKSTKQVIETPQAPAAVGPYSQAIKVPQSGSTVYLSGQIGLDPEKKGELSDNLESQTKQVFKNLKAVAHASGGDLTDIVKLTIYLTDMSQYKAVNKIMMEFFQEPYPARAAFAVKTLPLDALIEVDAILWSCDNDEDTLEKR